jgi:type IV pilus assembly protein PilW
MTKKIGTGAGGFTLIEMLIAIAVFGILMTGVYGVFHAQVKSHYSQQQVMEMQQNLRAALDLMEYEIKMAGFNPMDADGFGIRQAESHLFQFTMDNDEDGLTDGVAGGEEVTYKLSNDGDGDGQNDGGVCNLWRNGSILALNIDALNFVYLDVDGGVLPPPIIDLRTIRSIQVSLVARSSATPSPYTQGLSDTQKYDNQNSETILPAQNDSYRRRMLSMEVKCRNMGI